MKRPVLLWYEPENTPGGFSAADILFCGEAMQASGFERVVCTTPVQLLAHTESSAKHQVGSGALQARVLAILGGRLAENSALAHALRSVNPAAGILACVPDLSEETQLLALQSGIDAWFTPGSSRRLVLALMFSLLRRMGGVEPAALAAASVPGWQLIENAWKLQTPTGQSITLSTTERVFLLALVGSKGQSATHEELARALGPEAGEPAGATRERMSVMVSRLRRKVAQTGSALPVRSLHGQGYVFISPVS